MGATMIRMYDWDARNNHLPFLDYCQSKGIKVLVSVSNYYLDPTKGWTPNVDDLKALVQSFGNAATNPTDYHPAVAGIVIGNEPRLNNYDAAKAILVTNLYIQAEQAVRFPSRPMIGHPVDFALYGGQYPCWGFWDALLPGLTSIKNRLFLAPQTYNDATYLFTDANGSGKGYVPLTYDKYKLPLLFTEIGQDRNKTDYTTTITGQLTGSIRYAAENPGRLLGTAFFQFADKGWVCPAGGSCPTEGSFGAFSHSGTQLVSVPYTGADFIPYHYDYCYTCANPQTCSGNCGVACSDQTVRFDVLTPTASYGLVKAAYSGGASCGGQAQSCCTTGTPCNAGLSCVAGTCQSGTQCGAAGQPCCAGNTCKGGLTCTDGICTSGNCGAADQPCCAGNVCNGGLTCVNGVCAPNGPCGRPGQICCSGKTPCTEANTVCNHGTCAYCGFDGQVCCANNTCAQPTIVCLSTGKCANCGLPTLPCCAGDSCSSGTCTSGTCTA